MVLKPAAPEFSRPLEVGRIGKAGAEERLEASLVECSALAKRLGLQAIHGLRATLFVKSWRGGGVKASGNIVADLEQVSVISLEAFRSEAAFPVEQYYLPEGGQIEDGEGGVIEPIIDGRIDLGELVAETLALELDPYPRKPGETFSQTEFGPSDGEGGAFAGLKRLPGDFAAQKSKGK